MFIKTCIKQILVILFLFLIPFTGYLLLNGITEQDVALAQETDDDDILLFLPAILSAPKKTKSPVNVSAVAGAGQVTISWDAVQDATSYNIYWSNTSGVTKSSGTKITGATSPYIHSELTNSTKYYYTVAAEGAKGESDLSSEVSAVPFAGWIQTQINPNIGRSLYATDAEIYAATYDGVFSTTSDGMPWFSKGLNGENRKDVSDVITSNGYILAATLDGVYRSSNNGETWDLMSGSPSISAGGGIYGPHVFAKNSTHLFLIAWARGIFRSADNGETWEQTPLGNDGGGDQDYASGAVFVYTVGEQVFINGDKPFESGNVIWTSTDNGDSWNWLAPPNEDPVDSIKAMTYNNGNLFACGTMGVYLSTDLGLHWTTQYSNTIDDQGHLVGIGQFRNIISYNNVLVTAVDFHSIFISHDNGVSWISFNEGLIDDWTFTGLAVKLPYIWALTEGFGNAYRRSISELGY
ncbi:MAG: hypothetical protein JW927_06225 [Deltaproteobacteria bacterium]|nr:hypothetical protein [Deltaproteobacteria bacterium]